MQLEPNTDPRTRLAPAPAPVVQASCGRHAAQQCTRSREEPAPRGPMLLNSRGPILLKIDTPTERGASSERGAPSGRALLPAVPGTEASNDEHIMTRIWTAAGWFRGIGG